MITLLTRGAQVFAGIMDFYAEGMPVINEDGDVEEDSLVIKDDDSEVQTRREPRAKRG